MRSDDLLAELRRQPFYRGQILRTHFFPGDDGELVDPKHLLERSRRLKDGSLGLLLETLGLERIHRSLAAGLERAFPDAGDAGSEDTVLALPFSRARDSFWHLACLLDVLDEGRVALVLCHNSRQRERAFGTIQAMVRAADVGYAIDLIEVETIVDFGNLAAATAAIVVVDPTMLEALVSAAELASVRDAILPTLGRVVLPGFHQWPPATLSHTAHLMRRLQVECAVREAEPALLATSDDVLNLDSCLSEFFGRSIPPAAFIRKDTVESCPCRAVFYTGAMVRDRRSTRLWIRQDLAEAGKDLLDWLIGHHVWPAEELHYVLDISGSMAGSLEKVGEAILADYEARAEQGELTEDCRVKLTTFHTETDQPFNQTRDESLADNLRKCLEGIAATGGTDVGLGLVTAMTDSLKARDKDVRLILLSDGYGDVGDSARADMLDLVANSRSAGHPVDLLYILLDMEPPAVVRNLVTELGGRLVRETVGTLGDKGFERDQRMGRSVVVYSGENGFDESLIQDLEGGRRKVVFTRDLGGGDVDALDVYAVVASGRFSSLREIRDQVRHLGVGELPVFILTEAEAWSNQLSEGYVESEGLRRVMHISSGNPAVLEARLLQAVGTAHLDWDTFHYLRDGSAAYESFRQSLSTPTSAADLVVNPGVYAVGSSFEVTVGAGKVIVQSKDDASTAKPTFDTFTNERIKLTGERITLARDASVSPLVNHRGAIVDSGSHSAEVGTTDGSSVTLVRRSGNRSVPLLRNLHIEPLAGPEFPRRGFSDLGDIDYLPIRFQSQVTGVRTYPRANLDDISGDEGFESSVEVDFPTLALVWKPRNADLRTVAGLANLLRIGMPGLFRFAEANLLVAISPEKTSIHVVELAPGGNAAAKLLYEREDIFRRILQIGGRMGLDCPCEGGFAGASTKDSATGNDTGCPRCTRTVGPVLLDANGDDLFRQGTKPATLEWLLGAGLLQDSAAIHLEEKFKGVNDLGRIAGGDDGSRRGMIRVVRRILADRLGIVIDDAAVATCAWLQGASDAVLGAYSPDQNALAVVKGMIEWLTMDVVAHELFHNFQHQVPGLFEHGILGSGATPQLPFGGKLFIEGSAQWAESHVVDALAIRTALDLTNLRQGDEYGEGFQIMKWIEEKLGGVRAVLQFLSTGDISTVSEGKIADLAALSSKVEAGV